MSSFSSRPFCPATGLALAAALLLAAAPRPTPAVSVRIASWNVLSGLDSSSDRDASETSRNDDWWQVVDALDRVRPDIVGFAELNNKDFSRLPELAATLGYPYYALSSEPMNSGEYRQGVMSKFEITSSSLVKENAVDPDAREIKRWPIHATIAVPGALNPLHVFVVHTHPGTATKQNAILRAMNAWRMRQYLDRMAAELPEDVEYVVMGDFNEDAYSGEVKWDSFDYAYYTNRLTAGTPFGDWFRLGSDFPWSTNTAATIPYRPYPTDRFGAMAPLADTFRTGLEAELDRTTYPKTDGRVLDYILFSDEILQSAYGAPQCEVYWASNDLPNAVVGLPKPGPWLDTLSIGSDLTASKSGLDHLMVFGDFHMIDAVQGLTPVAIISEVATVTNHPSANFVEISNTGAGPLSVDGYTLDFHYRDNSSPAFTLALTGSIPPNGSWWAAPRADWASNNWCSVLASNGLAWSPPDLTSTRLSSTNFDGRGAVVLRNASGVILDVYGAIAVDGAGKAWQYSSRDATRVPGVTEPINTWDAAEWSLSGLSSATPGHHDSISEADVSVTALAYTPAAPSNVAPFDFSATVQPNALASNLHVYAHFSLNGAAWTNRHEMANANADVWTVSPVSLDSDPEPGDLLSALVEVTFDGPGGLSPAYSSQHDYVFPGLTNASGKLRFPLFNEVAPAAGFLELVGPANLSLAGWSVEHWSIAETNVALLWTNAFPADFTLSDSAIRDEWSNKVGFAVHSSTLSTNFPAALVLRNPQGTVADAVAWLPAADPSAPYAVDFLPDTVLSTNVAQGLANYLHVLGPAPSSSTRSLQAPNWVLAGRTTDALVNLTQWTNTTATAGSINSGQSSKALRLVRVDRDDDSLPDDADNCPATPNPTQADVDGDGLGDDCDPDLDGDTIPNALDNCPYTPNPEQEDADNDGIGDACDDNFDPDLLPPSQSVFVTFETVAPSAAAFSDGGRDWTFSSASATNAPADLVLGTQAARLFPGGTLTLSGPLTNGLSSVAFFAAAETSPSTNLVVETSSDGNMWSYLFQPALSTNLARHAFSPAVATPVHFRIRLDASASTPVLLDNLRLVSPLVATADADLDSELVVDCDGLAHTNSFTVVPASASWSVVYTNAVGDTSPAPSSIGSWTAVLTVEPTLSLLGGTFVFPASLVIREPVGTPVISDLVSMSSSTEAMLAGYVTPNRSDLPVVFEYGTSLHFGNKVAAKESPVSGNASIQVNASVSNLPPSTLHYWRILAADVVSPTLTFTTDDLPVPSPSVAILETNAFLVRWSTLSDATNYVLDVRTVASGGSAQTLSEDFTSWTYYRYRSGNAQSSLHEQETLAGVWATTNASVYDYGGASGVGSTGYVALATRGWLQIPPLPGVEKISLSARTFNNSGRLALQVSEDGGVTFATAATFAIAKTAAWQTNEWTTPLPDGAILRLSNTGSQDLAIHDLSVSSSADASVRLPGYPADIASDDGPEAFDVVSSLSPGTTYYLTVTAQGPGWESSPSPLLAVTTLPENPTSYQQWLGSQGLSPDAFPSDADSDGDGISNLQEYLADTNPSDPASRFEIFFDSASLASNAVVWTFPGSTSRVYQLLTSTNLVDWVTNSLSPDPSTGDVSFTNSLLSTLFSRLRASLPPTSPAP
jgi:endonuclease/exonuclease/phosphatase family metal-dependent hydrolase